MMGSHLTADFRPDPQSFLQRLGEHWFLHSPLSEIRLRRIGPSTRLWGPQHIEECREIEQFEEHFLPLLMPLWARSLKQKRGQLPGESCLRWIFSESDLLPGLIVDIFGTTLVAQISTAPIEKLWPVLKRGLEKVFIEAGAASAAWRELRNAPVRKKEGLEIVAPADDINAELYSWNGLQWWMSPGGPQKTGAYLDQRDNHRRALGWAQRLGLKEAWDLCSFEGGFGLHLAKSAQMRVLAVDQSDEALQRARRNAEENGILPSLYQCEKKDVFLFLREAFDRQAKVPMIVLDPPSFVKGKSEKKDALRGFKELNLRALHCLEAGGLLVSCACSHHISREDYGEMLRSAAHDARRNVRILEQAGPSPDHAPVLGMPESEYLQAWFLGVD